MKSRSALTPLELAVAAWPAAVGRKLAAHTKVLGLERGTLAIEVLDEIWSRNLSTLRSQILSNIGGLLGADIVHDVQFRVAVPRRPPAREETLPRPQIQRKVRA